MHSTPVDAPRWLAGDVHVEVDPDRARRNKAERMRRFHTRVVPTYRAAGLATAFLLVVVLDAFCGIPVLLGRVPLGLFLLVYNLVAWATLRRWYRPGHTPDLALVFLMTDLAALGVLIYATGGPHSWFLPLLFLRVADQGFISYRRSLLSANLTVATFAGIVAFTAYVDGAAMTLRDEVGRIAVIYAVSLFFARTSLTAERLRRRTASLLGLATSLIAELEQKSAAIEEARARAEQANRAKSEFLANMSHELRTPLHAVIGLTEVLRDTPLSAEQRDCVDTVAQSGDQLLELIGDVLDFSRIESGQFTLEDTRLDVRDAVERVARLVAPHASAKSVSVSYDVDPLVPRAVMGDPLRVRQVLTNLAGNAVKFTDTGRVRLSVRPIAGDPSRIVLRFEVQDTGVGIPPEAQPRLFEAFAQADSSTTRRYGGSGLGLAISRRIVELMHGRIGFESQVGQGSTFWFQVPFAKAPAIAAERYAAQQVAPPPATDGAPREAEGALPAGAPGPDPSRAPILVVEDNPINQTVALRLLRKMGYSADVAANGAEAVKATEARPYGLVLMDCQMPEMDGFEATTRIRQRETAGRRTPIVAMTANATIVDRERCFRSGMDDYLAKPVRLHELRTVMDRWLRASA